MDRAAQQHRFRNILGGSAVNLVEWFDWYAYSAFALYFARRWSFQRETGLYSC